MEKTVVIADDDLNCGKYLFNSFSANKKNINVVGIATNGEETLEIIKKLNPNFLILDLKMPIISGIEVLNYIEKQKNNNTKVIIISGESDMINTLDFAKYNMIINIFIKPFKFGDLYNVILNTNDYNNFEIRTYIDEILHNFKFNFSSKFYHYLLLCIEKALSGPLILNKIYKSVSKQEKINQNRLKWGIQKLILSMVRYTPTSTIKEYIPYNTTPTPKIFIYEIVQIVRKNIESNN